jgi:hypothetical protein
MLKKIWDWLKSALEAPESAGGGLSSKRLYGITCLVVAIILAFAQVDSATKVGIFLGAASAVFIAQAASGT